MKALSTKDVGAALLDLRLVSPQELSDAMTQTAGGSTKELLNLLERRQLLTSFQIQKLENGDRTGYFLGRFKVLYKVSAGTFARVFRGIDTATNESIAVKVLRGRHTADPESVRQFHREAKITAALRHPNIVRQLEVGVDRETNQHYIAMEFVEGGNFREFLRIRKKIDPAEMVRLGVEMVEGLSYALKQGLTHRDIKPTNILISSTGQIKLVDFGLAGVVDKGRQGASTTEQRTVDYAGLEKATGAPTGDLRSDIYFLGAVFAEALTGEPPLSTTKDKQARMHRSRFDQVRPLSTRGDIPAQVAAVVDRMLAFRPELRYQDYASLLADLRALELSPGASRVDLPAAASSGQIPAVEDQPRILLVHKNQRIQETIRQHLAEKGYRVVLTNDIHRAVQLFQMRPASCLIVDLDSSGQEGVTEYQTLLRQSGGRWKDCPAIFLATADQLEWTRDLDPERAVALTKPLTLGPVYRAVKKLAPKHSA